MTRESGPPRGMLVWTIVFCLAACTGENGAAIPDPTPTPTPNPCPPSEIYRSETLMEFGGDR
jgi:hypothetical protein